MSRRHPNHERPITIAVYEQLPEEDEYRVDLVRGRLVRSPRPAPLHGVLQIRIGRKLDEFVERTSAGVVTGDVGAILSRDPDTVRGPDVAFYSTERIPESGYGSGFWGPPDLAVEIVSPSNRASEVQQKVADYFDAGVRMVWAFDPPTRSVTVHLPGGSARSLRADEVLGGDDVLPGFELPLTKLFALWEDTLSAEG